MRLAIPDMVSNSYFPAIAAVELGYVRDEGLEVDLELLFPVTSAAHALKAGAIDFLVGAAHSALYAFQDWKGVKLINAVSKNMYWLLVVKSELDPKPGDLGVLRNLRIGAAPGPDLGLIKMLESACIQPEENSIEIGPVPGSSESGVSFGVSAARRLAEGVIDGFWANAMATEIAVTSGTGKVVSDPRREGGVPASFTFPALMATEETIEANPDATESLSRAIIRAQRDLKQDPTLATRAAKRLFPELETSLIAELIARDAPYYAPEITKSDIDAMNGFAKSAGLLSWDPGFDAVVSTGFRHLWRD